MENNNNKEPDFHKHLSTAFVVVGIISFTLGAIVNYYTIKRLTASS